MDSRNSGMFGSLRFSKLLSESGGIQTGSYVWPSAHRIAHTSDLGERFGSDGSPRAAEMYPAEFTKHAMNT